MAGLVRYTQTIFASSGLTGTAGFGAAANGTTTTENGSANTPSNIMTGTSGAWTGGWIQAVLGASKFPAVEDMNAVNYVFSYQLGYLFERGIPEYDSGTTYNIGDITRAAGTGNIYISKIDTNLGNALSVTADWQYCGNIKQLLSAPSWCGTSGGSANAQTLTTGASLSALTAGSVFTFTAGATNTAAMTIAIDSVSATSVYGNTSGGVAAVPANTIISGNDYSVLWDGTHLVLLNASAPLASYQATPADPASTSSTSAVMCGLAGSITPTRTGRVLVIMSGTAGNGAGGSDSASMQIRYGTGSAPTNGAAATGTAVGNKPTVQNSISGASIGWSAQAIINGLTVGTAYWLDLTQNSNIAGTTTVAQVGISAQEI